MKLNLFHLNLLVNFSSKLPIKLLKFQEQITATADKRCTSYASVFKNCVGNAFSSELET